MGGKWIIRLRKGLASRCWENLILAMLGEQFMVGEEICGAVVSVRFQVPSQTTHPLNVLYTPYQGYYSFENFITLYFYLVFYLSLVLVSLTRD